jgi:cytidyltransferase-like protein
MKLVLVTGGFDPIHSGHLQLFEQAKKLGDKLIVGVNSDSWLIRKKGKPFLPCWERMEIIRNLRNVDQVFTFLDEDDTAIPAIAMVKQMYPQKHQLIFANGGDRTKENTPEMVFNDVDFVFGVGGEDKINSSSKLLDNWKTERVQRSWGYYRVLDHVYGTKVKELTISPGQSLSMQRHKYRSEFWHVSHGSCCVSQILDGGYALPDQVLHKHNSFKINRTEWHRLSNPFSEPCKIVEIQYGDICDESDIERK